MFPLRLPALPARERGARHLHLMPSPLRRLQHAGYGESEANLAQVFKKCRQLGGCIVFLVRQFCETGGTSHVPPSRTTSQWCPQPHV